MKLILDKIRYIDQQLHSSERSFEERTISFMAIMGGVTAALAFIVDILIKEHPVEVFVLGIVIIACPVVTCLSVHFKKITAGAIIQVATLIFIIVPVTFFFGGGPKGGGIIWVPFIYMYVGFTLSGAKRTAFRTVLGLLTIVNYVVYFFHPEYIYSHTDMQFCVDSIASVLLVGTGIYAMVRFQKDMFMQENRRAQEETKKAEEANRQQSRFFSNMSHEIRTPINSILGLNEIILRQNDASEEIIKDARNIQGAGKMLLALVNDILDISKIEANKMDIIPVNYSVASLVSEIVNMIWLNAEQKGLQFEVDIDPAIPTELYGDEVRIKQILVNILNNAVKYTNEGQISLHMEREKIEGDRVLIVFSISDTGMGIKQEALPYLFDAFHREDEEKNRFIEGTGLGLSIVKQLVELMGGKISVNSVYTQGSIFTVSLWQKISNAQHVGEINIANFGSARFQNTYECSFEAPEARLLIVDDNEMNLEVEKKLLESTKMFIDVALTGQQALEKTLTRTYDVILMDHLMPEMDGIECLERIRRQTGGLNNNAPVIVLTANAGTENRELYTNSGFDDYLVKPVSGKQLEDMLIKYLPDYKISTEDYVENSGKEMNMARGYSRKLPILITTSTMCDLPKSVVRNLIQLETIPFNIHVDGKTFSDNVEAGADELISYMNNDGKMFESEPPTVGEFEKFFADNIKKAHNIIHIAFSSGMSKEYHRAGKAASVFDNVTVVDSESISSAMGLMVLIAYRMAQQNLSVEKIVEELENIKKHIHCSFIVPEPEFMMRQGFMSYAVYSIIKNLALKPSIIVRNNKFRLYKMFTGGKRECYEKYINTVFTPGISPDLDVLFVTYADLKEKDLVRVEEQIKKKYNFANIIFQKACAAASLNCGPGTIGMAFINKGEQRYNLGLLLPKEQIILDEEDDITEESNQEDYQDNYHENSSFSSVLNEESKQESGLGWYENISGIDVEEGLKNSGSQDSFKTVLKIFYDSISAKQAELQRYFETEDWENYTIKVHALKSSAKLVGAMDLSIDARLLEFAGKEGDISYIRSNHDRVMEEYGEYLTSLAPCFEGDNSEADDDSKPIANKFLLKTVYQELKEGAGAMNLDMIDGAFEKLEDCILSQEEADKVARLKECYDSFDYDGMLKILDFIEENADDQ
ncbi:DegV family protein [Butyrivibrio sp. MC2021]|uniref:DegV family protein n=1 Tax=Butyrivibrio sp. MC2021 TaxID=1408306 RepID=UPI0009DEF689|nr:DegV family protein [Butyrivibrio sp. MC2021]